MTIPVAPANINPQVHQTEDPFSQAFLQALLQGTELGQRQRELELRKQELKLHQQAQKFEEMKFASTLSQAADQGRALLPLLLGEEPQSTTTIPQTSFGPGQAVPEMAIQAPMGEYPAALRQMAPQSLPGFVEVARPELNARRDARIMEARVRSVAGVVERLPESIRQQARDYLTIEMSGTKIPNDMLPVMFPGLVPTGVDPQTVANSSRLFIGSDGVLTYGDAARLADPTGKYVSMLPQELLGARMVPVAAGGGKPSELQSKSGIHYISMAAGNAALKELQDRGVRLSWAGGFSRDLATQARGSGAFSFAGNITNSVLYSLLPADQQNLIQSSIRFGNAFRYQVSGQQTSDRELSFILGYVVPQWGDRENVVQQKALFREMVLEATRSTYEGRLLGSEAIADMIRKAQDMQIPQEILTSLEVMQRHAKEYEQQGSPPVLSDSPTASGTDVVGQVRAIIDEADRRAAARDRRRGPN